MFAKICLLGAMLTAAFAGPAVGQESGTAKWGQVGGWRIAVDRTGGNSCFAVQRYDDGTSLLLGLGPKDGGLYFLLGNTAWPSLQAGKNYRMKFVFDNRKDFEGEMAAVAFGGKIILAAAGIRADLAASFMAGDSLRLYHRDAEVASLSLRDTDAALLQVMACQQEMWAATGAVDEGVRPASDLFSR